MKYPFFLLFSFGIFIFSCQSPSPTPENKLVVKDTVFVPKIPIDTTGTGPSLSKKEDSIFIMNASKTKIAKRVEVWKYENAKLEKGVLTLSQTFYGGGARIDSLFDGFPKDYHLYKIEKYDSNGLLVEWDDLPSQRTIRKYDSHNNPIEEICYYKKLSEEPFVNTETHFKNDYDAKGNLIRKRSYDEPGELLSADHSLEYDAAGNLLHDAGYDMCTYHKVQFDKKVEYDSKNRKTKETLWCDAADTTETTYSYDEENKIQNSISKEGRTYYCHTKFYYDKKGNKVVEENTGRPEGDGTASYVKYKWTYYTK